MQSNNETLRKQFIIKKIGELFPEPDGWQSLLFSGWHLVYEKDLRINKVTFSDGMSGLVLGFALDDHGLIDSELALDISAVDFVTAPNSLGRYLELRGRFLILVNIGDKLYLVPDPCNSLGVLFSKSRPVAASSDDLLKSLPLEKFYSSEYDEILEKINKDTTYWHAAGNSAFPEFKIHYANHVLELSTSHQIRFWPKTGELQTHQDQKSIAESIEKIAARLILTTTQIAKLRPLTIAVTAGYDSRMMVAAAHAAKVPHDSVKAITKGSEDLTDVAVGRAMAEIAGFAWSNDYQESDYAESVYILGLAGEIAKAQFWFSEKEIPLVKTAAHLAKYLHYQHDTNDGVIERGLSDWLADVPTMDPRDLLDLAYIDHRMTCTMGQSIYRYYDPHYYFPLFLLNDAIIIEELFKMPYSLRQSLQIPRMIIRRLFPALDYLPYNALNLAGTKKYTAILKYRLLPQLKEIAPLRKSKKFREILYKRGGLTNLFSQELRRITSNKK